MTSPLSVLSVDIMELVQIIRFVVNIERGEPRRRRRMVDGRLERDRRTGADLSAAGRPSSDRQRTFGAAKKSYGVS